MIKTPFWPISIGYKDIDLGLDRMWQALENLGSPHKKLPKVIHFAGTNGKGSTLSFVKSILNEAGYKCHCYTSPHLVEFNERIVLSDKQISDEFLNEILKETKNACEGIKNITFFEGTTLAALLAFSKVQADYVLLETGLGGNLDATNVIEKPELSIITSIDLDHQEFLGHTIAKIAYEKARILKPNCKAVISEQKAEALEVIQVYAKEINCALFHADKIIEYSTGEIGLQGEHQFINASTAKKCAEILNIDEKYIKLGIKNAKWPARLEKIENAKLNKRLEKINHIYLDGGHNPQAAKAIKKFVASQNESNSYAIIAMSKAKDIENFALEINGVFDKVYCIDIPEFQDSADSNQLAKHFSNSIKCDSFSEAIEELLELENGDLYICGSLYFAGWFKEHWQT